MEWWHCTTLDLDVNLMQKHYHQLKTFEICCYFLQKAHNGF